MVLCSFSPIRGWEVKEDVEIIFRQNNFICSPNLNGLILCLPMYSKEILNNNIMEVIGTQLDFRTNKIKDTNAF